MALTGVHVACGVISIANGAALVSNLSWSQTMASPTTTAQAAPNKAGQTFEIRASFDVYISVGPNPDATNGARVFVPANETRNILCYPGDFLAWIAA